MAESVVSIAIRWSLAGFYVFVAAFYTARILQMRAELGRSPVIARDQDPTQQLTHVSFRFMRALILIVCLARAFEPGLDVYLLPCSYLWLDTVMITGMVLLAGGFVWTLRVHFLMQDNWRSGSDATEATTLITDGPFRASRNPAMLGVQVAQLGFFLALPSVFSFACLVIGIAAIQAQVRVEEKMLHQAFGPAYATYAEKTPRWL